MSSTNDSFNYEACPLRNLKKDIRLMEIEPVDKRKPTEITIRLEVVELRTAAQRNTELELAREDIAEKKRKLAATEESTAAKAESTLGQDEAMKEDPAKLKLELELAEIGLQRSM